MLSTIIERLNEKRHDEIEEGMEADAGFTLIELMVVLLIMAILLAIAIPTFLGVKGGAQDRAAQSNLNTALTNAKAVYGNNQTYGASSALAQASLTSSEASLTFNTGTSTNQNTIAVATDGTGNGLILVAKSSAGDCWGIETNETTAQTPTGGSAWPNATSAGTYYTSWNPTTPVGPCTATSAFMATWQQNSFPAAK